MKSKKPFLFVCAAALTLVVALPFMGVFAFAEDDTYDISFFNERNNTVTLYYSADGISNRSINVSPNTSVTVSFLGNTIYSVHAEAGSYNAYLYYRLPDTSGRQLSGDSSSPTSFDSEELPVTIYISSSNASVNPYYISVLVPLPDPLAPVSDGMYTMISVFGDVIDFIINTPDVAIFVAISVASCAIIPMGIILIKKLIKGY